MQTAFEPFVLPFTTGVIALVIILLVRYATWLWQLPKEDKRLIRNGIFTTATFSAAGEVFMEALIHRNIFRTNPLLGYMHMSLAFGWFLLIIAGKIEGTLYLGKFFTPFYTDIFFRKLYPMAHVPLMGFVLDFLLLFILSGVALALFKRFRSTMFGMKRTTRHTTGDRLALSSLWLIFPLRLLAESFNSALYDSGNFLTGSLGHFLGSIFGPQSLPVLNTGMWWAYSIALGVFFVALPYSRYAHILAEIPLVFLRKYGLRAGIEPTSFHKMQYFACSRCGICLDPCQLNRSAGIRNVQSVYFLRDKRHAEVSPDVAGNCLLCGRCEKKCPVGIELNTLRLSDRYQKTRDNAPVIYDYLSGTDASTGEGKVGYFAGCMGALTPTVTRSMENIFTRAGVAVWYADREGGVCCGRPALLTGDTQAAQQMAAANKDQFEKHGITTLVTSCPICLKTFRQDYGLTDVRVVHHSEYILELLESGQLKTKAGSSRYVFHDPCELGRGSSVYEEPRKVLQSIGTLCEPKETREEALCCGGSLGNTQISLEQRQMIARDVTGELSKTGAECIVTGCPLCKKTLHPASAIPVIDIAEAVSMQTVQ